MTTSLIPFLRGSLWAPYHLPRPHCTTHCNTVNWKPAPACLAVGLLCSLLFSTLCVFLRFPHLRDSVHVCASFFPRTCSCSEPSPVSSRANQFLPARLGRTLHGSELHSSLNPLAWDRPRWPRGAFCSVSPSCTHTSPHRWCLPCLPCCGSVLLYLVWQDAVGSRRSLV